MLRSKKLNDLVQATERDLAKYKFVLSIFPDAEYSKIVKRRIGVVPLFKSKSVNKEYDRVEFENGWQTLYVTLIKVIKFIYDNKEEEILVTSSPKRMKLASIVRVYKDGRKMAPGRFARSYSDYKHVIKFSHLGAKTKQHNISEEVLNQCRIKIMEFVKANSGIEIDVKSLDPRLKKLVIFS